MGYWLEWTRKAPAIPASLKGAGQAAVVPVLDNVVNPRPVGDGQGVIAAAVIDDERF